MILEVITNVTHLHTVVSSRQKGQAALATQNARVDLPLLAAVLPRLSRLATPPLASASVVPLPVPLSPLGTVLSSTAQQGASQPTVDKPVSPSSSLSPSRAVQLGQTSTGAGCKLTYSAMGRMTERACHSTTRGATSQFTVTLIADQLCSRVIQARKSPTAGAAAHRGTPHNRCPFEHSSTCNT